MADGPSKILTAKQLKIHIFTAGRRENELRKEIVMKIEVKWKSSYVICAPEHQNSSDY